MRTTRQLQRAIAPALLLATVAVPTGMATAGDARSGGRSAVPADFVTLTDDTSALTIAVPSAWSDVDTAPGTNDDGTVMPWISAAPNYTAFIETFDVPGALFIGVTYTTDLQSWITRIGQPQSCQASSSEDYDDGAFVGTATTYEQCGPNQVASLMVVAANAGDDTTRTYVLALQASTPDDVAVFEPVLSSFHAVGITQPVNEETAPPTTEPPAALPAPAAPEGPGETPITLPDGTPLVPALPPGAEGAPTTTVAASPTTVATPTTAAPGGPPTSAPGAAPTTALPATTPVTTVGAAPTTPTAGPFTPTNSLAVGAVQVTDDSRTITVAVPPDWLETVTTASAGGLAQILAGPQLAGFAPGGVTGQAFTSAGVRFTASPFTADTAAAVTAAASALPCTPGTVQAYEDPVFTGHIVQLTDCGGTTTRLYLVEANPADATLTASLLIQVTDFDDSDLQTILSSFDIAREDTPAAGPTPTTAPAGPTTAAEAPTTAVAVPTTAAVAPTTVAPPATAAPAPSTTAASTPGVYSPPASIPGDTLEVIDDTGFIRVGVPPAWVDRRTTSFTNANGGVVPQIVASASVAAFIPGDSAVPDPNGGSGVIFSAVPFAPDPAATLGAFAQLHSDCMPGIMQPYQDSVFAGVIQEFTACGGTQTRRFVVIASPADQRFTALVTVQVTDDPSVLGTVLATFDYDPNVQLPG